MGGKGLGDQRAHGPGAGNGDGFDPGDVHIADGASVELVKEILLFLSTECGLFFEREDDGENQGAGN